MRGESERARAGERVAAACAQRHPTPTSPPSPLSLSYVEEYLVVGEAPEQVRNCFQQRSRWCKGHFQIVFGPRNPLLQKELSWPMRIMYCSGVWSYFVGAMTTPLFMLIPLLTIWAGMFPIVVSKWAAAALTLYMVGQTMVTNFMHKRR